MNKKLKSKVEGKEIRFADNIVIGGWGERGRLPIYRLQIQASTNLRGKDGGGRININVNDGGPGEPRVAEEEEALRKDEAAKNFQKHLKRVTEI